MILERLSTHGSVDVADLSGQLSVSQASVRRDLQLLESQQLLTRTHGGAVSSGVLYELPMRYRGGQRHEAKRAIARCAVGLLGSDVTSGCVRIDNDAITMLSKQLPLGTPVDIVA